MTPHAQLRGTSHRGGVAILVLCLAACGGGGGPSGAPLAPNVPALAAGPPPLLTLALVGDTHTFGVETPGPLDEVRHIVEACDVFVFNHEGALYPAHAPPVSCPYWPNQSTLVAPAPTADIYPLALHNVAALGNNHVLDCDLQGLLDTQAALAARGIGWTGAGGDRQTACAPHRFTANGIPIAVVSYLEMDLAGIHAGPDTAGAASWSACNGAAQVATLKAGGDFVIACLHLHLGASWVQATWPAHLAVVEEALDAGADIVVVHGPHVPQGVLTRPGQVAFLSLGNFLFRPPHAMPEPAHRCVVARVALYADRLDVALVPFRLDAGGVPRLPTPSDAERVLGGVVDGSVLHGTSLAVRDYVAYLSVPRGP